MHPTCDTVNICQNISITMSTLQQHKLFEQYNVNMTLNTFIKMHAQNVHLPASCLLKRTL